MPTLSVTKTYQDGDILSEADLDNIRSSLETFFNTTKINSTNVQASGISATNIGINDSEFLTFGTGDDGQIGVTSDDFIIKNVTTDKDIIFNINDGGVATEVFRIDGDVSRLVMNNKEITGLATPTQTSSAVPKSYVDPFGPPGIISAYGAHTAPTGWLLCDGSAVSRTTYAALFAIIGTNFGNGDASTTFNVPDLRGRFLRGRDAGTARDPDAAGRTTMATGGNSGDNVGSIQTASVGAHDHTAQRGSDTPNSGGQGYGRSAVTGTDSGELVDSAGTGIGNETRPINAYVVFIIKT